MNKKKTMIAAVVLLLVFVVGGTIAYFTDTKTVTNTFTIGNVSITLTEPNWVAANAQDLMPGENVAKDPTITNTSTANDAYVFMKVVSPCTTDTPAVELLPYTANSGWTLMTASPACTSGTITRLYAYGTSSEMNALAPNGTATLFNQVTLANIDGSETLPASLNIVVTAYAIQADGLGASDPTSVWTDTGFTA